MNSELCKQALAKVGNPNILVNIISRRVRQLTSGGGSHSRPLIADTAGMGAADVALTELLEDKFAFEMFHTEEENEEKGRRKKKRKG